MTITTEQLKEIFAKIINELDPSPSTEEKIAIAKNPNTQPETLDRLSYDENRDVRYWVASNRNSLLKTLERLSYEESWSVRYWVARNPSTPPETLERLSNDKNGSVRNSAKNNPNFQKPITISMTVKEINTLKKLIEATQDEDLKSLSSKL